MKGNDYYSWSDDWRLETIERPLAGAEVTEYFLENAGGGKIVLDKPVYDVLKFLSSTEGNTFAEIDRHKMVSSGLLEILLKVFARVGVLTNKEDKQAESGEAEKKEINEKSPLISVVIVNYNGDRHFPDLLDSLKRQSYNRHEIIIIDNHSTDHSCQWVKANYPG
ncbi:MAG: hypothetical protein QG657_39, partial [Acidobacteriota bacterium]|nr:hypothetical protein [Acidobacteriota bacterium]